MTDAKGNTGSWNTGHRNTGDWNTGDWNTGHRNTGYRNTGHRNTGGWNTGSWNTGDWNTGFFNTTTPEEINCFNKSTKREQWEGAYKPDWLYRPSPTTWVSQEKMTDKEKQENPDYTTCGGYLRKNDMKEEWKKAYATATEEDIQAVRDLPNFDPDVFEEITGLDLRVKKNNDCEGKLVEIEGITYQLKRVNN